MLVQLKAVLDSNSRFHQAFEVPNRPKFRAEDISQQNALPFSSVSDIAAFVQGLSEELVNLRNDDCGFEMQLGELQSRMLKSALAPFSRMRTYNLAQPI